MSSDGTQVWETTNWKPSSPVWNFTSSTMLRTPAIRRGDDGDLAGDLGPRARQHRDQQGPEHRDEHEGGQDREPERAAFGGEDGRGHVKDTWVRTKAMMSDRAQADHERVPAHIAVLDAGAAGRRLHG